MSRFSQKIDAAANSSWVFTRLRTILRASVVFNIAGTAVRSLSGPLAAIERSLQGRVANERRVEDDQCMVSLVERSVLMRNVERLVVIPVIAFSWRSSGLFFGLVGPPGTSETSASSRCVAKCCACGAYGSGFVGWCFNTNSRLGYSLWIGCDLSSFLLSVSSDGRGVVRSLESQRLFLITKLDETFLLE